MRTSFLPGNYKVRNLFYPFMILFLIASAGTAKQPAVQIIKVKSQEIKIPIALRSLLLKELTKDNKVQLPDPRNPFSAHEIALNGDNTPEIEITANSGGANAPMWIFSKQGKQFALLLKANVGIYGYNVLKPISYGYHDVLTVEHASAIDHQITIYRFNGKRYKQIRRFMETEEE